MDGPLSLTVNFWLPRPASLTKKRIADGPCRKPDIDKLIRSSCDALTTAGAIADDARIVRIVASKRYVLPTGHVGADFAIESMRPAPCPHASGATEAGNCARCGAKA